MTPQRVGPGPGPMAGPGAGHVAGVEPHHHFAEGHTVVAAGVGRLDLGVSDTLGQDCFLRQGRFRGQGMYSRPDSGSRGRRPRDRPVDALTG